MMLRKKLRYYVRLWMALLVKQRFIILTGMLIGFAVFFIAPKVFRLTFSGQNQKIGVVGLYSLSSLPSDISSKISRGLTRVDASGTPQPDIAEYWEVRENGKLYIFSIKQDQYWHDGQPIQAKDINFRFSDVTARVIDDHTISFELMEAYSPFPVIVSQPLFKTGLIGNGDYALKSIKEKSGRIDKLVLKSTRDGSLLTYRFYPNQAAAKTAFKLGEIHVLPNITDIDGLEKWPNISLEETRLKNRYAALFFNVEHPHLGDKNLRQSLAYAVVKDWPFRCLGPISPDSWVYNPGVKPYSTDLSNAKALFGKYQDGRDAADTISSLELSTLPSLLPTAEKIKSDWEQLGFSVKIKVINGIEDNYEVLLLFQESPPDPDQYPLWHSTQPTNLTHYSNPKIDVLLEEGRKTTDPEERKDLYLDFQRFIVEESPAVFLYHPIVYTVSRN